MIAQLLEKAPLGITEDAVQSDPAVAAVVGGMDVQQAIVDDSGARPVDASGNPRQGSYITASGNLLADFTANANAELQGRLQVARLWRKGPKPCRCRPASRSRRKSVRCPAST